MGRKVFVSYKYKDENVATIQQVYYEEIDGEMQFVTRNTRVRDYVNKLQEKIGADNVNLGEKDGESLEEFSDDSIETELKRRIFQSSITIVLISKGMRDTFLTEKEQWIPWEISYSLRTVSRENRTSRKNGILGIVLPDSNGTYDWYYRSNPECNSVTHFISQLFEILKRNMFNVKEKQLRECNGTKIYEEEPSYIKTVKWDTFMDNSNWYIEKAIEIRDKEDNYKLKINIE